MRTNAVTYALLPDLTLHPLWYLTDSKTDANLRRLIGHAVATTTAATRHYPSDIIGREKEEAPGAAKKGETAETGENGAG